MFDNIHPDFKETLDRFCSDTARAAAEARRKPDPEAAAAAFSEAVARLFVKARDAGADIIGHAHVLFHKRSRMSPGQVAIEMGSLRDAMRELNGSFSQLEHAHAAMTVGETASRIRGAVEPKNAAFADLESKLMRTMAEPVAFDGDMIGAP